MQSIFRNLKVVELASVLAGPAVGNFFAELGAKVIKVENKAGGDITRHWRQADETEQGPSAYYASVNWNKQSVFLDLNETEDKKKVRKLITDADVVLSNFKKGDDVKFGLTFEEVKTINPSVIYGHITGFGSDSDRVAYDLILQAETGFMSINGQPESPPTKIPLAIIDVLAAHQLKEGILCAMLKQKEEKGKAFYVEVSLYESAVASLINQATNWLMNRNVPQRIGSLHPNIAPYGEVFRTQDNRSVTLAIGNNRQFQNLCSILGLKDVPEMQDFQTNRERVEHREKLFNILSSAIEEWPAGALLASLHRQHIPAGEIKDIRQVFESSMSKNLLLKENKEGRITLRPRTAVFGIRE